MSVLGSLLFQLRSGQLINRRVYIKNWRTLNRDKVRRYNRKYYYSKKLAGLYSIIDLLPNGKCKDILLDKAEEIKVKLQIPPKRPMRRWSKRAWDPFRLITDAEFSYNLELMQKFNKTGKQPTHFLVDIEKIQKVYS